MEVYGKDGAVICQDNSHMQIRLPGEKNYTASEAPALPDGMNDPFAYFANVINGTVMMDKFDLSAPENNRIVIQILEAAKASVKTGKTIIWKDYYRSK